nr:myosin-6-like isoform X2 [Ipomoea batatas]
MAAINELNYRRDNKAAIAIERHCRGFRARLYYRRLMKAAIATQCAWRMKIAKRELRKLKMAAKEAAAMQAALEKQVEDLTSELEFQKRMRDLVSSLEKEKEDARKQAIEAESKVIELKTENQRLKEKISDIETEEHILRQQALLNSQSRRMSGRFSVATQPSENGHQDEANNNQMAYWLSNTSTLLFLLQHTLRATTVSTPHKPPQPTSFFGRMFSRSSFSSSSLPVGGLDALRQVMKDKIKITYDDLITDLCPILGSQQLYRLCTLCSGENDNTGSVSEDVISSIKILISKEESDDAENAFLLDDNPSIPFSVEELSHSLRDMNFTGVKPAAKVVDQKGFEFLRE